MKILHTIHATGEYDQLIQHTHEFDHSDLLRAYYDINKTAEAERTDDLDKFSVQTEHGIFTSCPVVTESYVIIG